MYIYIYIPFEPAACEIAACDTTKCQQLNFTNHIICVMKMIKQILCPVQLHIK